MGRALGLACLTFLWAGCSCAAGETKNDGDDISGDGGVSECDPACADDEVCVESVCVPGSEDGDGDGFPAAQDCDDTDPDVNPDASEVCNGIDDDCSGRADEPFDDDRDGYTTCGGGDVDLRDCNDRDPAVHPGAPERCNGADDDCDGGIDEDDGEEDLCPAGGFCIDGACAYECPAGTVDLDGNLENGCECESDLSPDLGVDCDVAIDEGEFNDNAGGETREYTGIVVPEDREVWYRFRAVDVGDDGCDAFHVRVQFLENPDNQFIIDLFRDDPSNAALLCAEPGLCGVGDTDFEWYTDVDGGVGGAGQCPCTAANTPGANLCTDETADFAIRVRRVDPGAGATCDPYRIEISNGVY